MVVFRQKPLCHWVPKLNLPRPPRISHADHISGSTWGFRRGGPASPGRRPCLPALISTALGSAAPPAGTPDQHRPGKPFWTPPF